MMLDCYFRLVYGFKFIFGCWSLFSMNALKDSWNNFKSNNHAASSQLKFKELADYESVPDNDLSLDGIYWKKKFNALAIMFTGGLPENHVQETG